MGKVTNGKLIRKELSIAMALLVILITATGCVESSQGSAQASDPVVFGDDAWIKWYLDQNQDILQDMDNIIDATERQDTEDMYYDYKQFQTDIEVAIDEESSYQTSEKLQPARDEWMKALKSYEKCAEIVLSCYDSNHNLVYRSKIIDSNPFYEDASTHQINSIHLLQKLGMI